MEKNLRKNFFKFLFFVFITVIFPTSQASVKLGSLPKGYDAQLRLTSFNIRNFSPQNSFEQLTDLRILKSMLLDISADIFGLQEIVDTYAFGHFVEESLKNYRSIFSDCGGSGKQKLGFLYNTTKVKLIEYYEDSTINYAGKCHSGVRPAFIARFKHYETHKIFTIVNLHLKAGGDQSDIEKRIYQYKLLTELINEIKDLYGHNIIVLGDLNTTSFLEQTYGHEQFSNFLYKNRLRNMSKYLKCTSYWSGGTGDGHEYPSHLDHIMVTNQLKYQFKSTRVSVESHCRKKACNISKTESLFPTYNRVSDHCPVVLDFK